MQVICYFFCKFGGCVFSENNKIGYVSYFINWIMRLKCMLENMVGLLGFEFGDDGIKICCFIVW